MKPETSFWKFEARNPKQIIMTEIQMFKTVNLTVRKFGHSNFDIVSDFDIQNSDFILCGLGVLARKTLLKSFC